MARKSRPVLTDEQSARLVKILEHHKRKEESWARLRTWVLVQYARLKIWVAALAFWVGSILMLYDFYRGVLSALGGGSGAH